MTRKRAARPSVQAGRASVYRQVNTDIVAENLRTDWERGCLWAGIGMVAVWGPLLVLGACLGWW